MVKSLYNKEIAQKIREIKPPYSGIVFDIIDRKQHIAIKLSERNLSKFNSEQLVSVMEYIYKVLMLLEAHGIKTDVEGIPNLE